MPAWMVRLLEALIPADLFDVDLGDVDGPALFTLDEVVGELGIEEA